MRDISASALVEALAHWGAHEASGRLRGQVQIDVSDRLACVDLVLRYRAAYVARILARQPLAVSLATLDPGEVSSLRLADGRGLDDWIAFITAEGGTSLEYFRQLVERPPECNGWVLAVAKLMDARTGRVGPLVLYDGWHRAAAWFERNRQGLSSTLAAFLVVSQLPDRWLSAAASRPGGGNQASGANKSTRAGR